MGGDSRIGKCCCGGSIPTGTRGGIWQYAQGHAGWAFLVGESYPYSWLTSFSGFSATYRSIFAANFVEGFPDGFPDGAINVTGTYAASSGAYTITGDNIRFNASVFNLISGKTATSSVPVSGTGILLFRTPTGDVSISNAADAIAFIDDYSGGFSPRIVAYGDTDEWLPRPASGYWRVYSYVDYEYYDSGAGQASPWWPGLTVYQEFSSLAAAEAYLATL